MNRLAVGELDLADHPLRRQADLARDQALARRRLRPWRLRLGRRRPPIRTLAGDGPERLGGRFRCRRLRWAGQVPEGRCLRRGKEYWQRQRAPAFLLPKRRSPGWSTHRRRFLRQKGRAWRFGGLGGLEKRSGGRADGGTGQGNGRRLDSRGAGRARHCVTRHRSWCGAQGLFRQRRPVRLGRRLRLVGRYGPALAGRLRR